MFWHVFQLERYEFWTTWDDDLGWHFINFPNQYLQSCQISSKEMNGIHHATSSWVWNLKLKLNCSIAGQNASLQAHWVWLRIICKQRPHSEQCSRAGQRLTNRLFWATNWSANRYHGTGRHKKHDGKSPVWLIGILPPCGKINIVLKCKECGWAAGTLISNCEWMKNQSVSVLPILWKKPERTLKVFRELCFCLAFFGCLVAKTKISKRKTLSWCSKTNFWFHFWAKKKMVHLTHALYSKDANVQLWKNES